MMNHLTWYLLQIYRIIKVSFSKKEGIKKKISYERRVYESVEDESLT